MVFKEMFGYSKSFRHIRSSFKFLFFCFVYFIEKKNKNKNKNLQFFSGPIHYFFMMIFIWKKWATKGVKSKIHTNIIHLKLNRIEFNACIERCSMVYWLQILLPKYLDWQLLLMLLLWLLINLLQWNFNQKSKISIKTLNKKFQTKTLIEHFIIFLKTKLHPKELQLKR